MPSNIEIKARIADFQQMQKRVTKIADGPEKRLEQEDTFFNSSRGRLKLRVSPDNYAELIYYERRNQSGPKHSEYCLIKVDEPETLKNALGAAIGIRGIVRKTRHLYYSGQTRIHLDEVEHLGYFLEIEVVLRSDQSLDAGEIIARNFMVKLGIAQSQLIQHAYIDLLEG